MYTVPRSSANSPFPPAVASARQPSLGYASSMGAQYQAPGAPRPSPGPASPGLGRSSSLGSLPLPGPASHGHQVPQIARPPSASSLHSIAPASGSSSGVPRPYGQAPPSPAGSYQGLPRGSAPPPLPLTTSKSASSLGPTQRSPASSPLSRSGSLNSAVHLPSGPSTSFPASAHPSPAQPFAPSGFPASAQAYYPAPAQPFLPFAEPMALDAASLLLDLGTAVPSLLPASSNTTGRYPMFSRNRYQATYNISYYICTCRSSHTASCRRV